MRLDVVGLLHRAQSVTLVLGPYMRAACLRGGGEAQVDCAPPDFARDMHPPTWSALMTGQKALTEQQPAVVEPTEKTYPIVPASSAHTAIVHLARAGASIFGNSRELRRSRRSLLRLLLGEGLRAG